MEVHICLTSKSDLASANLAHELKSSVCTAIGDKTVKILCFWENVRNMLGNRKEKGLVEKNRECERKMVMQRYPCRCYISSIETGTECSLLCISSEYNEVVWSSKVWPQNSCVCVCVCVAWMILYYTNTVKYVISARGYLRKVCACYVYWALCVVKLTPVILKDTYPTYFSIHMIMCVTVMELVS